MYTIAVIGLILTVIGLLYKIIPDIRLHYKEKNTPTPKTILNRDAQEFTRKWEELGQYDVRGSHPDKVEQTKLKGWEIINEHHKELGKTFYFVTPNDGLIYMRKKKSS